MSAKSSLIVSSLVVAAAVSQASAATVDLSHINVSPGQVENVTTTGGAPFTPENTGVFNFNVSNPTGGAQAVIPGSTIATWCIELSQFVNPNSNTYTLLGPGFGLYTAQFANSVAITAFFNQFFNPAFNQTQATAFQLSVWELLFEGTPASLSTGSFQAEGADAAVTLGNLWLSTFNPSTAGPYVLFQLHNDEWQDQIFAVSPGGGSSPTPIPSSLLGGLALLAGAGAFAKLRRIHATATV